MGLFRRQSAAPDGGRTCMISELERLVRRFAAVPLAVPFLLAGGLGLGKLTTRSIALPEGTHVRTTGSDAPPLHLDSLVAHMESIRTDGTRTEGYVILYRDHIAPVEESLRRRGVPDSTARQVAWPLVEHSYRRGLDPATVLSVLWIESMGKPDATSFVGARGLMQVMPAWAGRWSECGTDLYDIEDNLCNGTSILAWNLQRYRGDERRALLAYNGCVRGTNTPDCFRYPEKVWRIRRQIQAEWQAAKQRLTVAVAP